MMSRTMMTSKVLQLVLLALLSITGRAFSASEEMSKVPSTRTSIFWCKYRYCDSGYDCLVVNGSKTCVDPCQHYSVLDDPRRSVSFANDPDNSLDDRNVKWDGWYRLRLEGLSARMPESCVEENRCGTSVPLWLSSTHPCPSEGIVRSNVCGVRKGTCCRYSSKKIHVKSCPGNFYIYKFVSPRVLKSAYCAGVSELPTATTTIALKPTTSTSTTTPTTTSTPKLTTRTTKPTTTSTPKPTTRTTKPTTTSTAKPTTRTTKPTTTSTAKPTTRTTKPTTTSTAKPTTRTTKPTTTSTAKPTTRTTKPTTTSTAKPTTRTTKPTTTSTAKPTTRTTKPTTTSTAKPTTRTTKPTTTSTAKPTTRTTKPTTTSTLKPATTSCTTPTSTTTSGTTTRVTQSPPAVTPTLVCGRRVMEVGLPSSRLTAAGLNSSTAHLADRLCSTHEERDGTVWYQVDRKEGSCGNTLRTNGTHAIFSNNLFVYPLTMASGSLPRPIRTHFSCIYPMDTEASLDVAIRPHLALQGEGVVNIGPLARASMSLFRYSNYTEPYPAGTWVTLPLGSALHVGVSVEETETERFVVVLEDCYATHSPDPDDLMRYFLIQNKCPSDRRQVTVDESGSSLQARFSALLFLFQRDYRDVFLHCSLNLCDQRSSSCSPMCSRRKVRSVSKSRSLKPLTIGPISWD